MTKITENILEQTCLSWLSELGWQTLHGPDIAPETPDAERKSYSNVILKDRLETSLSQINPDVPAVGIDEAVKKLLVINSPDLLVNNRNFPRLLTDGIDVEILLGEMHIPDKEKFIEDLDKSGGQNV